jgi:hypothetical protein
MADPLSLSIVTILGKYAAGARITLAKEAGRQSSILLIL